MKQLTFINQTNSTKTENAPLNISSPQQNVYDQINQRFNDQDEQNKSIQEAREILGEAAYSLTNDQVYDLVNEVQYLVDSWLEEFERKTFDGKTLNEIMGVNPK